MKVNVKVIHAFSNGNKGGNPAGVVFDADAYDTKTKQAIANRAGFPETAFVSTSAVADFKLDFFTPIKQIPHCGHATIATFSWLKQNGKIAGDHSSKETIDGVRAIRFKNNEAYMEQQAPTFQNIDADKSWVLKSLGLGATDLLPGLEPLIVNTGNGYLIIPVRDEFRLAGIQPDMNQIWSISEKYGLIGFYPYTPSGNGFDATARMFAPYYGINEEAGTGMAAGPLAVYLYETGQQRKTAFRLEQGRFMDTPSPSVINVELESNGGNIIRLFAGGDAYVATEIQVDISEI